IRQTKSRSYHSNDNALVETKNGSVIRKNMGWEHINRSLVEDINNYYKNYFNIYLNYHRPCGYPTITTDSKGKITKQYTIYTVPYEKLKQTPNADKYLKTNTTFKDLDKLAYNTSDNNFAKELRQQETKLFDMIQKVNKSGVSL
ncbi:MAG: integrase, partial [Patescibacteria group bacterium]